MDQYLDQLTIAPSQRLLTWYSIITVLFRCPSSSSDLTESSPAICRPYLTSRSVLAPHFEPYYRSYAAPYVDTILPYVSVVDDRLLAPAVSFGKQYYQVYGAPRAERLWAHGQQGWQDRIRPTIDLATSTAKQQYQATLGQHVGRATSAAGPYLGVVQGFVQQSYGSYLLPAYETSTPYAKNIYQNARIFTVQTGVPYAVWTWNIITIFLDRTIWPRVRILYGENVEPQLVRIGERLGRYRDGRRLKAAFDSMDSTTPSSTSSTSSPLISPISSSLASARAEVSEVISSVILGENTQTQASSASMTEAEEEVKVREKIASDLRTWQEKFAKAADKGSDDLEERVKEITEKQIDSQVNGVGKALLIRLDETVAAEVQKLKRTTVKILETLPVEANDSGDAQANEEIIAAVRKAGVAIKGRALAVRAWKQNYLAETHSLIQLASESTLDIIDGIRDLGLQEIGMRWAWMEGVTYKDWSNYHELRKTFDDWREEIVQVVRSHAGIVAAEKAAEDIEAVAMAVAEETAAELTRLKKVSKQKILARDASDDFTDASVSALAMAAIRTASARARAASEAAAESVSQASEFASSAFSIASDSATSHAGEIYATISSSASNVASEVYSSASSIVSSAFIPPPALESIVLEANERLGSAVDAASVHLVGTSKGSYEKASSVVADRYTSAQSEVSAAIYGTETGYAESAQSRISEAALSAESAVSIAIHGSSTATGTVESLTSVVAGVYESASSVVGDNLSAATSIAGEHFSSAQALVNSAVYGAAERGAVEKVQDRLGVAVDSARVKLAELAEQAGGSASEALSAVKQGVEGMTSSIMPEKASSLSSPPTIIPAAVANVRSRLADLAEQAGEGASEALSNAKENARSIVSDLMPETPSSASAPPTLLPAAVESARAKLAEFAGQASDIASDALSQAKVAIMPEVATSSPIISTQALPTVAEGARAKLAEFASQVGESASEALSAVGESMQSMASDVMTEGVSSSPTGSATTVVKVTETKVVQVMNRDE